MKHFFLISLSVLIFGFSIVFANNIQIDTIPYLSERNLQEHCTNCIFNLSWENSWKTEINYDAAWIFVKYRIGTGRWRHATLSTFDSLHSISNNNGVSASIKAVPDGKGVFIYRTSESIGNNNFDGINLRWNYGIDSVPDEAVVAIRVFAIEMCYVPDGSYFLGSGGTESNRFYKYPTTSSTYQVTSEDPITVGQYSTNLWATGGIIASTLPSVFPKGYHSFYCMKYEINQKAYCDFLNTLTSQQQSNRFPNSFNSYRHFIRVLNGIYGCDGNNNGIFNDADDGQWIACNFMNWADGCAYADWSGLRPMTELEYEKACRGTITPIPNEYAWGNTNKVQATGISNSKMSNEVSTPSNANSNYDTGGNINGPLRVGNFARSSSTRESSGGSYFGIMDLSGNLTERIVTIGNAEGCSFTGISGDGILDANGFANVTYWPGIDALGSGFRGGNWVDAPQDGQVSYRYSAVQTNADRTDKAGFRCVRSGE